ncbi:hypothetical protein D3C72_2112570 [compost metagenome]
MRVGRLHKTRGATARRGIEQRTSHPTRTTTGHHTKRRQGNEALAVHIQLWLLLAQGPLAGGGIQAAQLFEGFNHGVA